MCNRVSEILDKAGREYVRKYEGVFMDVIRCFKADVATAMETLNSNSKTEKIN
jgi:hypothetical protein